MNLGRWEVTLNRRKRKGLVKWKHVVATIRLIKRLLDHSSGFASEPSQSGGLAATFDLDALLVSMIAPVKKSGNHSKTITGLRIMRK